MDFTDVDQQRAELEEVLSSAVFRKAPNQSRLLRYLCEYHLSGNSEPLKEHQIAVEALGRKTDFDQRENSIVRVEVSRVRKKLRQFYESEGGRHPLRIAIDPGQYIPRFEAAERETAEPEAESLTQIVHETVPSETPPWLPAGGRRSWRLVAAILAAAGILVAAAVALIWMRNSGARPAGQPAGEAARTQAREPLAPLDTGAEVRILAGYPRAFQIDRLGNVWRGDRYFTGGHTGEAPRQIIARAPDPTIYRYYRAGSFQYDIPLKPGVYEMRLHFAQSLAPWTLNSQSGAHEVYVSVNETSYTLRLNLASDGAASSTADVRVFKNISPAADGRLHLQFHSGVEFSFVNAIEITPGIRNRMQPIRITTREYFYTDQAGLVWPPDRWYRGGSTQLRREGVSGTQDPDLFSSERYGTFDYLIPVAQGTYAVKLGFAETWFGPTLPGGGGAGSRIFDVDCNGTSLVKNLDVYSEAGGPAKVLIKTFHGLQPREDGKLQLTFTPRRNYAMVNAIEVVDETK